MDLLRELLAGSDDHRSAPDLGGAIFSPVNDSDEALLRFQKIVERIQANDGFGYTIVHRLTHRSSDHGAGFIDRMVINIPS